MKIEHIAIWTLDLERMRKFYMEVFDVTSSEKYHNPKTKFTSYFLSFELGARIELMHKPEVAQSLEDLPEQIGLAHLAISLGSAEKVDTLTQEIGRKGYKVIGQPRTTGDGYYESVISDPEGNLIEITT